MPYANMHLHNHSLKSVYLTFYSLAVTLHMTRSNIQKFHVVPTLCIDVFRCNAEQMTTFALYNSNWLVIAADKESV